jgi:hypothetical protein
LPCEIEFSDLLGVIREPGGPAGARPGSRLRWPPSKCGNPFIIGSDGSRDEVIAKYRGGSRGKAARDGLEQFEPDRQIMP